MGDLGREEIAVLRFVRAHSPATLDAVAAFLGEPTTNFGRQRLGQSEPILEALARRALIEQDATGQYRITDHGRHALAEIALASEPSEGSGRHRASPEKPAP
jgi:DNA-binding PadR family transcriptional regulator